MEHYIETHKIENIVVVDRAKKSANLSAFPSIESLLSVFYEFRYGEDAERVSIGACKAVATNFFNSNCSMDWTKEKDKDDTEDDFVHTEFDHDMKAMWDDPNIFLYNEV